MKRDALAVAHRALFKRFEIIDHGERELLRNELIKRSQQQPSATSHNRGGWRSGDDLFTWDFEPCKWLWREIQVWLLCGELRGWGVVNTKGASHNRHRHRASFKWSGIYYLDSSPTKTIFEIGGVERVHATELIKVEAQPGLLVIFPTDMWHSVEEHQYDEPRVAVAFDAR